MGCCEAPVVVVDGNAGPHEVVGEGEEVVTLGRGYVGTENANGATSDTTCGTVVGEGETGDSDVGVVAVGGAASAEGDGAAEGEDDEEKRKYEVVRLVARSIELPN